MEWVLHLDMLGCFEMPGRVLVGYGPKSKYYGYECQMTTTHSPQFAVFHT